MIKYNLPVGVRERPSEEIIQYLASVRHLLDESAVLEGKEFNTIHKPWDDNYKMRFVACVPTKYSAGVNNMGLNVMYDMLNRDKEVLCERSFLPEPKLIRMLEKEKYPLGFSLESKHSLNDFDVIGFSSYFELQFLTLIKMLQGSGIPVYTEERDDTYPIVVLGGVSAYSVAPVDQVVDMVFIGDGEIQFPFFKHKIPEYKSGKITKDELLLWFAKNVPGCYVPKFYEYHFRKNVDGSDSMFIDVIKPKQEYEGVIPNRVTKAFLDLSVSEPFYKSVLPAVEGNFIGYNSVEVARGCHSSCRFCMVGSVHKPYREHNLDKIQATFKRSSEILGTSSITPYSLNYSAFSQQSALAVGLTGELQKSATTSSQRADSFCPDVADVLSKTGTRNATLAFEGGSQRMRDVINKEVSNEDIYTAMFSLIDSGYQEVKIYMISNLPWETEEDRNEILNLLKNVDDYRKKKGSRIIIRVSYTEFTAKPYTALQWADVSDWTNKLDEVYKGLSEVNVKYRRSTSGINHFLLQAFNRLDRRFNDALVDAVCNHGLMCDETVYMKGKSDDDIEQLFSDLCLKYTGYPMIEYLREMPLDTYFPWYIFNVGYKMGENEGYLENEYRKAMKAVVTPSCAKKCTQCGICTDEELVAMGATFPQYHRRQTDMDKETMLEAMRGVVKTPTHNKIVLELKIDPNQRDFPVSKYKTALKASLASAGFSLKGKVDLLSDTTQWDSWVFGLDMAVLRTSKPIEMVTKHQLNIINERLKGLVTVERATVYPKDQVKSLQSLGEKVMYYGKIQLKEDWSPESLNFENKTIKFRQKQRAEGMNRTTYVDTESVVTMVATPVNEKHRVYNLYVTVDIDVNMYDVLRAVLDVKNKRELIMYPFERKYLFNKPQSASVLYPKCKCGSVREVDIKGKPLESVCLSCLIKESSIQSKLKELVLV